MPTSTFYTSVVCKQEFLSPTLLGINPCCVSITVEQTTSTNNVCLSFSYFRPNLSDIMVGLVLGN